MLFDMLINNGRAKRSRRAHDEPIGALDFAPDAQEREYIYQKKKRTAYNFRCLIVSTQDPTEYVLGER